LDRENSRPETAENTVACFQKTTVRNQLSVFQSEEKKSDWAKERKLI